MGNVKNTILFINKETLEKLKEQYHDRYTTHVVELKGEEIHNWSDYITEVQSKFEFPSDCLDSVDRYLDWIRDLSWLKKDEYVLIINNYSMFMKNNDHLRNQIIEDFTDLILPFWEEEVKQVVVKGKAKPFMIYLVD